MRRIVYALDGSEASLCGARLLARLKLSPEWRVTLLTVMPESGNGDADAIFAAAREALTASLAAVETRVQRGNPAEQILEAAEEENAELIVLGSRGLTGLARFLIGSVAERVARHAVCSVLVARPLINDLRQILLGYDGSEDALAAAERLLELPLPEESEVHVVTAMLFLELLGSSQKLHWPPELTAIHQQQEREARERLEKLVERFAQSGRSCRGDLRSGDPATVLLRVAEEQKADLIVVGSSGVSGIERFLLGSVSEKVLRHASCSVLIAKQQEHASQ